MLCGSDRREVTVRGDEEAHKTVQKGQTVSAVVVCVFLGCACCWRESEKGPFLQGLLILTQMRAHTCKQTLSHALLVILLWLHTLMPKLRGSLAPPWAAKLSLKVNSSPGDETDEMTNIVVLGDTALKDKFKFYFSLCRIELRCPHNISGASQRNDVTVFCKKPEALLSCNWFKKTLFTHFFKANFSLYIQTQCMLTRAVWSHSMFLCGLQNFTQVSITLALSTLMTGFSCLGELFL